MAKLHSLLALQQFMQGLGEDMDEAELVRLTYQNERTKERTHELSTHASKNERKNERNQRTDGTKAGCMDTRQPDRQTKR